MKKRDVILELLARGPVLVNCDGRRCDVPEHLRHPLLALRFGYNLTPRIPDLRAGDDGLSGTLSFGGKKRLCRLPWPAVYGATVEGEEHSVVWPGDQPKQDAPAPDDVEVEIQVGDDPADEPAPPPKRPHLKLV